MSGTALYRALIEAGASQDVAKEASDSIELNNKSINDRLTNLEVMMSEVRATNRVTLALILMIFIFILKLSFIS